MSDSDEFFDSLSGVGDVINKAFTDLGEAARGFMSSFTDEVEEEEVKIFNIGPCSTCPNMRKKELRKYDNCPECGKSLFVQKQNNW